MIVFNEYRNRKEKCKKPLKRFDSNESQRDKKLGLPETNQDFELTIIPISDRMKKLQSNEVNDLYSGIAEGKFTRKLRPINDLYPMNSEWREIADTITNVITINNILLIFKNMFILLLLNFS